VPWVVALHSNHVLFYPALFEVVILGAFCVEANGFPIKNRAPAPPGRQQFYVNVSMEAAGSTVTSRALCPLVDWLKYNQPIYLFICFLAAFFLHPSSLTHGVHSTQAMPWWTVEPEF
jgi:hypothetical protein